jgi:DNA (cytosine-5)-methyltransferase 1
MTLRLGELFAGYGGLGMAVEEVFGAELAWVSEWEPAPSKILAHHWPDVPNHGDITKIDWSQVEPVDVISGGYPCQPFSLIGNRTGKAHAQHLWPYTLDAVRHLRPKFAVFENVAGHLSLGFDTVLGDLTEIGYDVRWTTVRASTVGAPHKRERLFIVATDARCKRFGEHPGESSAEETRTEAGDQPSDHLGIRAVEIWGPFAPAIQRWERITGRPAPHPTIRSNITGKQVENLKLHEWMMGLPEGWVTEVPGVTRREAGKALGNGVVPQQAKAALTDMLHAFQAKDIAA